LKSKINKKLIKELVNICKDGYKKMYKKLGRKVENIEKLLNSVLNNCDLFIIDKAKHPIGFIAYNKFDNAYILRLWGIHKDFRNSRLSIIMIDEIIEKAIKEGIKEMTMITNKEEIGLGLLAKKRGFKESRHGDEMIYVKELKEAV